MHVSSFYGSSWPAASVNSCMLAGQEWREGIVGSSLCNDRPHYQTTAEAKGICWIPFIDCAQPIQVLPSTDRGNKCLGVKMRDRKNKQMLRNPSSCFRQN